MTLWLQRSESTGCAVQENDLIHRLLSGPRFKLLGKSCSCVQMMELSQEYHVLYTSHTVQQPPPPFDYTIHVSHQSLPPHHPSPLSRSSHPSLFTSPNSPTAPSLALCRLKITAEDKVLMISIQFILQAHEYTVWINPEIYDINLSSSSKVRDDQEEGSVDGREVPCRGRDYLY